MLFPYFVFAILAVRVYCDLQVSGTDNDQCAQFCSKTYPAHTFDQNGAEQSCKQGCRLFSIISAIDKVKPIADDRLLGENEQGNVTASRASCTNECVDAYSDKIFRDACADGCEHQTVFTTGHISMVVDDSSPFYPFASRLINNAMGKFGDMKSQFENFRNWFKHDIIPFSDQKTASDEMDDNTMVSSFQRMADRLRKLFHESSIDDDEDLFSEDNEAKKPRLLGGIEDVGDRLPNHGQNRSDGPLVISSRLSHVEGSEFKGPTLVDNEDENGEPIIVVKMIPLEDTDTVSDVIAANEPSPPTRDVIYGDADDGWLACLARRTQNLSILSRWLLCAALMLSILCMFWLCLALMRNQRYRRRRLYMQYQAGKSDVVYFMPPPAYEKAPPSAAYIPLEKEQKVPPSPPPAYEARLEAALLKADTAQVEGAAAEK